MVLYNSVADTRDLFLAGVGHPCGRSVNCTARSRLKRAGAACGAAVGGFLDGCGCGCSGCQCGDVAVGGAGWDAERAPFPESKGTKFYSHALIFLALSVETNQRKTKDSSTYILWYLNSMYATK
jgi:hypothetical protein